VKMKKLKVENNTLFSELGRIVLIALIMSILPFGVAQAIDCELTSKYGWNIAENYPVYGSGLSTVGEDLPVGGIIYSNRTLNSKGTYIDYTCDDYATAVVYRKIEVVSTPYGPPIISGNQSIYPTNVQGIGVVFDIYSVNNEVSTFPDYWEDNFGVSLLSYVKLNPLQRVTFRLVKTGTVDKVGSQQVLAASFPTFRIVVGAKQPVAYEYIAAVIQFQGNIMLHTKTCQISTPQIDVELGSHEVTGFTSPGSVTPWKKFDIKLVNCPPFYGYGNYNNSFGSISDSVEPNKVLFGFKSAYGTVLNNSRLAKIESGSNSATGVGIELSQENEGESIALDGSSGIELKNLNTTDNSVYTIPLQARYVQYDSEVKPGLANGAVVFTVTYQ
jgi:type 1 fimbria pilin